MVNEQDIQLPQWMQIGDQKDQIPNMSPFVQALKKRLNSPTMKQGGDHMAVGKVTGDSATSGGAPTSL